MAESCQLMTGPRVPFRRVIDRANQKSPVLPAPAANCPRRSYSLGAEESVLGRSPRAQQRHHRLCEMDVAVRLGRVNQRH